MKSKMEASYEVPRDHPVGKDAQDLPRWKPDINEEARGAGEKHGQVRVTIPISN